MAIYQDLNFSGSNDTITTFLGQMSSSLGSGLGLPIGALLLLISFFISFAVARTFTFERAFTVSSFFSLIISVILAKMGLVTSNTIVFMGIVFVLALFFLLKTDN